MGLDLDGVWQYAAAATSWRQVSAVMDRTKCVSSDMKSSVHIGVLYITSALGLLLALITPPVSPISHNEHDFYNDWQVLFQV
jgi:hypothetical protein